MIKKIFLFMIVCCSVFVGFSNAGLVQNGTITDSIVNSQFKVQFLNKGSFITSYLGNPKLIFALDNSNFFFWDNNGLPYLYGPIGQGEFTQYMVCNELTSDSSYPVNCSRSTLSSSTRNILRSFFQNVTTSDYTYYNYSAPFSAGNQCSNSHHGFVVCFSSQSIGQSMCFQTAGCLMGCQLSSTYCQDSFCPQFGGCGGGLTNSFGYSDLTFDNISASIYSYSPGNGLYGNIEGESQEIVDTPITGNVVYSTCSKQTALNWYERQGYDKKMCYASYGNNTDIYTGPGVLSDFQFTGLDISEVWLDTASYRAGGTTGEIFSYSNWFNYWRSQFGLYKKGVITSNPFIDVPGSLFMLFGNVNSYGGAFSNNDILEFCDLAVLTVNYAVPYSGINAKTICSQTAIDLIADSVGYNPSNGQVIQGSSWAGITSRLRDRDGGGNGGGSSSSGNGLSSFTDGVTFENSIFNLLSSKFEFPEDGSSNGIIPSYILITMFGLILFRFVSH